MLSKDVFVEWLSKRDDNEHVWSGGRCALEKCFNINTTTNGYFAEDGHRQVPEWAQPVLSKTQRYDTKVSMGDLKDLMGVPRQ